MDPHIELDSTRIAALGVRNWGWEIPVYLFLGGLVAGIMVAVSVIILMRGKQGLTDAMKTGLVAAPVLLSLGMLALFIDLTMKQHIFRFYTTLRPSAPMSLGSWILMLVYPVQALLVLAQPPKWLESRLPGIALLDKVRSLAGERIDALAWGGLVAGVSLGIYTGILLSATVAQPMWSSAALGLLFLVSGGSTGVAALMIGESESSSQRLLARFDIGLISLELIAVSLWLIGLLTQGPLYRQAAGLLLWGPYAPVFLGVVAFGGLLLPAVLEVMALRGKAMHSRVVPSLVLVGGLVLRFVVVYAGQEIGFVTA